MRSITREKLTIFTPLSGRASYWSEFSAFLDKAECDTSTTRLVFLDTSHSNEFSQLVKKWLMSCRFTNISYLQLDVGRPGLADIRRVGADKSSKPELDFEIQKAMCKIYNTMRNMLHTPYVWIIEDDIIPPHDALVRLFESMDENTASVSAAYNHRYRENTLVAWDENDVLLASGSGIQKIKGNGFGCVLMNSSVIREHIFAPDKKWPDFDRAFYHRLDPRQQEVKINLDIKCRHLSPSYFPEPCPHPYEERISETNFDENDYLKRYPDVKAAIEAKKLESGYQHYEKYGKKEGRIALPMESFDEEFYLSLYEDVARAIKKGTYHSGLEHYLESGRREGRYSRTRINKNTTSSTKT